MGDRAPAGRRQDTHPGGDAGVKRDLGLLATLAKLRREGKLYSGLAPTLVRAFPANAAQWLAWEVAADLLQGW